MLRLSASEALLYILCCKLLFVLIKCPTCIVFTSKPNARRALYWNKRQFATKKVKPQMHTKQNICMLIKVN